MKKLQHSPGPWLITERSLCGSARDILTNDGNAIIASVGCAEDDSDVCLIVAAPDMLDVLKRLVVCFDLNPSSVIWNDVHAAIEKAEGA